MALSGSFYTNVGARWRLQLEWTGVQSISGNYTDVTAKLFWISLDGYGAVSSSTTKTCALIVGGTTDTHSAAGMAGLSANQKKQIHTFTKRVTHNSDGTATCTLDGWFDLEVTLAGTYYGRINLTGQTVTLDTIPRASTLSSSPSWTAGNSLAISISRASSSFTHQVDIFVNARLIKQLTGIATSTTVSFTTTENTWIFEELNATASKATSITVRTYSGATLIGTTYYYGTCTAPSASTVSSSFDNNRWIDEDFVVPITRANSNFTHTVHFAFEGFAIRSENGVGTGTTWTWNMYESADLYESIPNDKFGTGVITVTTYYNGEQVRSATTKTVTMNVRNSEPEFYDFYISYIDTNSATATLTGDNTIIIQNKSTLRADVNIAASARNGATFSHYVVSVSGKSGNISTSTGSVTIGTITAGTNQTLTIKAVDSRGFETAVTKTVTVLAYTPPTASVTAERVNKFEDTTTLMVSGTFKGLPVSSVRKNQIQSVTYRYREYQTSTWTSGVSMFVTQDTAASTTLNYEVSNTNITLLNTKQWEIEVSVQDNLETKTFIVNVSKGQPIMFIDSVKKSVGIGNFPEFENSLEVEGNVDIDGSLYSLGEAYFYGGIDVLGGISMQSNGKLVFESAVSGNMIDIKALNNDVTALRVGSSDNTFGYNLKYMGSGTGNNNTLELWADNQTTTTPVRSFMVFQDGTVTFDKTVTVTDLHLQNGNKITSLNNDFVHARKQDNSDYAGLACGQLHVNTRFEGVGKVNTSLNQVAWYGFAGSSYAKMQNKSIAVSFSSASVSYEDFTWNSAFGTVCAGIWAQPVNSSSTSYNCGMYSVTTTGARCYLTNVAGTALTITIGVQVFGIGD